MKNLSLNSRFIACLLAVLTFNLGYSQETGLQTVTNVEMRCGCQSSTNQADREISRCTLESMNTWQDRAVYLKAGIESIAKETVGDELFNIDQQLMQNSRTIDRIVTGTSEEGCTERGSLSYLLNMQSNLIFDYTRGLVNSSMLETEDALAALESNLNCLIQSMTSGVRSKSERAQIERLLRRFLNQSITVSQNFVAASDDTLEDESAYATAYDSYARFLRISQRLGRVLGMAFCNHCSR